MINRFFMTMVAGGTLLVVAGVAVVSGTPSGTPSVTGGVAMASSAPASSADTSVVARPALMPVPSYGMSFGEAWSYGGRVMWVLALMSVFGLALVIYLLGVLRESQVAPRRFLDRLLQSIQSGDLAGTRHYCEESPCPLAAVALSAIDFVRQSPKVDAALLRDAIEAEGSRQAASIQGQTQILLDIAVIAPMLGLLGTVLGMLKAFGSVAQDVASAKPVVLAAGVSQAIITTIFGLIVAIFAMVAYAFIRRRAARQIARLETAAATLATSMMGRFES